MQSVFAENRPSKCGTIPVYPPTYSSLVYRHDCLSIPTGSALCAFLNTLVVHSASYSIKVHRYIVRFSLVPRYRYGTYPTNQPIQPKYGLPWKGCAWWGRSACGSPCGRGPPGSGRPGGPQTPPVSGETGVSEGPAGTNTVQFSLQTFSADLRKFANFSMPYCIEQYRYHMRINIKSTNMFEKMYE